MIASASRGAEGEGRPGFLRPLVVTAGVVVAFWSLRRGSVLRRHVVLDDRGLTLGLGGRERSVELQDVTTIQLRQPFEGVMHWVPTVAVVDVFEQSWEIPTVLVDGPEWLERFLDACGREDLRTWAEARGIKRSMERSGWFVPVAYAVACGLVLGAIVLYLR
jgi:hypothetical protein